MSGRWVEVGPGRSVWRPEPPGGWIGPDALEPYLSEGSRVAAEVAAGIAERWRQRLGVGAGSAGGLSHGERRERAAEVFGDPLPVAPEPERRPVVEEGPRMWDRTLAPGSDFGAMAAGWRTFGFWYGAQIPARGDVVVYVEHVAYRQPSPFGPSVAFLLGDVVAIEWAHGRPSKHVASLLPLPGISRAPIEEYARWGGACSACGWWPWPPELVLTGGNRIGMWRHGDQSAALMASAAAGMVVTAQGLLCPRCLADAGDVRRGQVGYELEGAVGGQS